MARLVERFHDDLGELGAFTPAATTDLPAIYSTLLSHNGHMTVTLEAFHESLVGVHAVRERKEPESYGRESLLTRLSDGCVVQCGIMRIDLGGLPPGVREAIEEQRAPLGRILIRNNLLREVELLALWKIAIGERLAEYFRREVGEVVYGRSARIHLEGAPRVDLLEIVTDDPRGLPEGL